MKRFGTFTVLIALTIAGTAAFARAQQSAAQKPQLYVKEQAERGAKQYAKVCSQCHDAGKTPPPGQDKGPPLMGEKFVAEWKDRTVGELLFTILTTMPNDGSAVLTESETADLAAHILQSNGFPDGPAPLKYDPANDTVIAK
jgi:mono/diheme cytochrome c family protein